MSKNLKKFWFFLVFARYLDKKSKIKSELYILFPLLTTSLIGILPLFGTKTQEVEADFEIQIEQNLENSVFSTIQQNTFLPIASPFLLEKGSILTDQIPAIVTAYSSSAWETDDDPETTAAGTGVRDGVIANNILPFGTKIRIPELYGDKIFVVEDRMHWRKGESQFDIWMDSYQKAKNFGVKQTYIEILEI